VRVAVADREHAERDERALAGPSAGDERLGVDRQRRQIDRAIGRHLDEGERARRAIIERLQLERAEVVERAVRELRGRRTADLRGRSGAPQQESGERDGAVATLRDAMNEPQPIDRLPQAFGKFLLKQRLARGGMADVFLATLSGAEGFEKELVVKLIRADLSADEGFVRRFVDEAKTCVRLAHPNIVPIFELGVEHGVLYMVMELVRGVTLGELLRDSGALSADEGAYVTLEVARALDHAHRRGVIHRDVTPGNVMIDDEGGVKLLDFGIAAPVQGGSVGEVFGTPGHMPPEQLEGRTLSPATDLFALATVALETWTGRAPFRRADPAASRSAMATTPPAPSATYSELADIDDLIGAMLKRNPAERPQHAEDVARRLRTLLRERHIDLDEVARALAKKVARAVQSREARAEGRHVPAPPMTRSMRPTPLAEGTRTFATRDDIGTRKIVEEVTRKVAEEGTRRIESGPVEVAAEPKRTSRTGWVVAVAAIAIGGAAVALFARANPKAVAPVVVTSSAPAASSIVVPSNTVVASASAVVIPSASVSASAVPSASAARLSFVSSPPALVEVDGKSMGQTPLSVNVAAGERRVVFRPRGLGEHFERRVTIAPGGAVEVRGDFNDEPSIVIRKLK
jgi:serine/threonine-protein kinase